MSDAYLDPAASIAVKFRTLKRLAEAAGVSESRACRWRLPKELGGTGGMIPSGRQQRILDWAAENGVPISPEDFFVTHHRSEQRAA
jgi:hypothetical protein